MLDQFLPPADWQQGQFTTDEGLVLRTASLARHSQPIANIILAQGMREFPEYYCETAVDFAQRGYNVYLHKSRARLIDHFAYAQDRETADLVRFANEVVPNDAPKVVLGFSKGALQSLMALAADAKARRVDKTLSPVFAAAALVAPPLAFRDPKARYLSAALRVVPFDAAILRKFVPRCGPYESRSNLNNRTDYTSDVLRGGLHDEWMQLNPALREDGLRLGEYKEFDRAMMALQKPGAIEGIDTPIHLIAADQDEFVSNTAIEQAHARIPGSTFAHFDGGHELFQERGDIRPAVINAIDRFFLVNSC